MCVFMHAQISVVIPQGYLRWYDWYNCQENDSEWKVLNVLNLAEEFNCFSFVVLPKANWMAKCIYQ